MLRTACFLLILSTSSWAYSQEAKGIEIQDYPLKIEWKSSDLERLANPEASTDCEQQEITWIYVDKKYSGGEHGIIERTWMAEDPCGNRESTIQFITLTD